MVHFFKINVKLHNINVGWRNTENKVNFQLDVKSGNENSNLTQEFWDCRTGERQPLSRFGRIRKQRINWDLLEIDNRKLTGVGRN
jgi:hypothetical protein